MSRCHLIINRAAGANQRGIDAEDIAALTADVFREAGHDITTSISEPGNIEAAIKSAAQSPPDILLVGGGDGTVSTAARLLGGSSTTLGILPMGTFNLAARDLGIPLDLNEAIHFLATAKTFPIDVLDVAGKSCLCATILGFYPEFSNIFENRDHNGKWWRKTLNMFSSLHGAFIRFSPLALMWTGEGIVGGARSKFSSIVPGRYRDSTGLIPARTGFTSGNMTAYIGRHRNPASAFRAIVDYGMGRQDENSELEIIETPSLTLSARRKKRTKIMLDGEILTLSFPIEFKILPRHLNVLGNRKALEESPTP